MKPNKNISPETIPYGLHLSLMAIPGAISAQLDALLVFHFVGAAALAVYSFATIFPEKLAGGLKFISTLSLPKFSERDEDSVKRFIKRQIWWILGVLALASGIYAAIAPWLFSWLFPTYMASVPYTQVYSLSFFAVAAGVTQMALTSQQKTKELYAVSFIVPATKALLLIVLMYYFGVWGIIWAQIISNIVAIFLPMGLLGRKAIAKNV